MGGSPHAVSNQRNGSRFPARPWKQPRGVEPGTSSFRGGRFVRGIQGRSRLVKMARFLFCTVTLNGYANYPLSSFRSPRCAPLSRAIEMPLPWCLLVGLVAGGLRPPLESVSGPLGEEWQHSPPPGLTQPTRPSPGTAPKRTKTATASARQSRPYDYG